MNGDRVTQADLEPLRVALREIERRRKARGQEAPSLWLQAVAAELQRQGFRVRTPRRTEQGDAYEENQGS